MDWDGLIKLGLSQLRLHPSMFWQLTPFELQLMAGLDERLLPMSKDRLADLQDAYPDDPR